MCRSSAKAEGRHTWSQAVKLVIAALEPLGSEYCGVLETGLTGRWCDRYPNQGKQSGAFSCGSYDGDPYILMNYQPTVLDHVFTLAHEAGHSMHSHFSAKHQPFPYYSYTIFVAEVASTFNEQLLSHYMMQRAGSDRERAFLINREIDAIRGTILRQTMFAEFERTIHALPEAGEPLTLDRFKTEYRQLLDAIFRSRFHPRRRPRPGMLSHSALLSGFLCLQIRHRAVGGDRLVRARAQRRPAGIERLSQFPQTGLLEVPARTAP